MPSNLSPTNNYGEHTISGEIDMATGTTGPTAVRGDGLSVARAGVGLVDVTYSGASAVKLIETLGRDVTFCGASAPTTALGCRVAGVTQTANTDAIVIRIHTTATSQGSGANTDGGTAVTLSFKVRFRFMKMGAWA